MFVIRLGRIVRQARVDCSCSCRRIFAKFSIGAFCNTHLPQGVFILLLSLQLLRHTFQKYHPLWSPALRIPLIDPLRTHAPPLTFESSRLNCGPARPGRAGPGQRLVCHAEPWEIGQRLICATRAARWIHVYSLHLSTCVVRECISSESGFAAGPLRKKGFVRKNNHIIRRERKKYQGHF